MMATIVVVYPQIGSAFASWIADLGKVEAAVEYPYSSFDGDFGQGHFYTHVLPAGNEPVIGGEVVPKNFLSIVEKIDEKYCPNWTTLYVFNDGQLRIVINGGDHGSKLDRIFDQIFPRETDPREIAAAITNHIPALPLQG